MVFVSVGAAFTPIARLGNLTSIGTLFAFVGGLHRHHHHAQEAARLAPPFRTPLVPLLPILGVLVNLGLMAGLGVITWSAFLIWMAIGLIIYFSYSRHTSAIRNVRS